MGFYKQFFGCELLNTVGVNEGTARRATGLQGHLVFGPHLSLEPGEYVAAFYIRRLAPCTGRSIQLDVIAEGVGLLCELSLADSEVFENVAGQVAMRFRITQSVRDLEARIFVEDDVMIEVRELVIFSTHPNRSIN